MTHTKTMNYIYKDMYKLTTVYTKVVLAGILVTSLFYNTLHQQDPYQYVDGTYYIM